MLMEISGRACSACSARFHTSPQDWPSSCLFPPGLSQRAAAQTNFRTMHQPNRVEVLPGREKLGLGAARYNTGKGSSCKIYLTVLPQTPVRGASLDRGPPSHSTFHLSVMSEKGGRGGARRRGSRKEQALKHKGRLTQRTPKSGWVLSGIHPSSTMVQV